MDTNLKYQIPGAWFVQASRQGWVEWRMRPWGKPLLWLARHGIYRYWNWSAKHFVPLPPDAWAGSIFLNGHRVPDVEVYLVHSLIGFGCIGCLARDEDGEYIVSGHEVVRRWRWGRISICH